MTVYEMNRWKSAKASEFTTGEGSGQMRTRGEDGSGGIKKPGSASQLAADETTVAAKALSPSMYPSDESSEGPIKRSLGVRGSQKLQAVRPDENPGPGPD